MFSNFHLTATREMKELKTDHGCSVLSSLLHKDTEHYWTYTKF